MYFSCIYTATHLQFLQFFLNRKSTYNKPQWERFRIGAQALVGFESERYLNILYHKLIKILGRFQDKYYHACFRCRTESNTVSH